MSLLVASSSLLYDCLLVPIFFIFNTPKYIRFTGCNPCYTLKNLKIVARSWPSVWRPVCFITPVSSADNVSFPNLQLSFLLFSDVGVHCQVMCNTWLLGAHLQGVLEAVRISCAGYRTRRTFYEFLDRFGLLAPEVLEGK